MSFVLGSVGVAYAVASCIWRGGTDILLPRPCFVVGGDCLYCIFRGFVYPEGWTRSLFAMLLWGVVHSEGRAGYLLSAAVSIICRESFSLYLVAALFIIWCGMDIYYPRRFLIVGGDRLHFIFHGVVDSNGLGVYLLCRGVFYYLAGMVFVYSCRVVVSFSGWSGYLSFG